MGSTMRTRSELSFVGQCHQLKVSCMGRPEGCSANFGYVTRGWPVDHPLHFFMVDEYPLGGIVFNVSLHFVIILLVANHMVIKGFLPELFVEWHQHTSLYSADVVIGRHSLEKLHRVRYGTSASPFLNGYNHVKVVGHDDIFVNRDVRKFGLGFLNTFSDNTIG